MKKPKFKWVLEVEIDEVWVADGSPNLNAECKGTILLIKAHAAFSKE